MVRSIDLLFVLTSIYFFNITLANAATTHIQANVVDGSCEVIIPSSTITFDSKMAYEFSSDAMALELHPLNVQLNCIGAGTAPSLKVTGESVGLADTRLFRSGGSDARGVGFMLKEGTLTDLSSFYTASGTVAPGDSVNVSQVEGVSTQPFTVGLVRGVNEAIPSIGKINAKISFTFSYP